MRNHLCNSTIMILITVLVLSACTPVPNSTPTIPPTSTSIPTAIAPTSTSIPTLSVPTSTSTPTLSTPTPGPQVSKLSKPPELILANNKPFVQTDFPEHVIYTIPETDNVLLASELTFYKDLKVDIYYPPNYHFESKLPVVIFSIGYPDSSGWSDKDITAFIDWAKLVAASGMIGVAAQAGSTPTYNFPPLLEFLAANTDQLGVDMTNIGFMAWSAQGRPAFAALSDKNLPYRSGFRSAAFICLDLSSVEPSRWPEKLSLIVVKAGKDKVIPGATIDKFMEKVRLTNIPTDYIELPNANHSFMTQDTQENKDVFIKVLEFFKSTLLK